MVAVQRVGCGLRIAHAVEIQEVCKADSLSSEPDLPDWRGEF
jgi:hypothetical protein